MTTGIMDEIEVSHIPTPNQIPGAVDLSQLPSHILRSGAVEALANQNEDLVARLSVALRRAALLENQISELEVGRANLAHQLSIAQDQMLVLQEKDRRLVEKTSQQESIATTATEHLQLLETQYAELYSTSRERIRLMTEQKEDLERRLRRYGKYRRGIVRAVRSLQQRVETLTVQWKCEEETGRDLKAKLGDAALRIQFMNREADANQRRLVENYELEMKTLRERAADLERQNLAYTTKTADFERLFEKSIGLENRLIETERQFTEHKAARAGEINQLEVDLAELRAQNKSLLVAQENLKADLESSRKLESQRADEIKAFTDQVETLQLLWRDGQNQQEKLKSQNQALQKLNQHLSSTINSHRQEIQKLKLQLESQNMATTERIKEIKGHLQMIGQNTEGMGFIESNETLDAPASTQVLSRIDTLIAEIQSGFRRQTVGSAPGETTEGSISSSSDDSLGSIGTATP